MRFTIFIAAIATAGVAVVYAAPIKAVVAAPDAAALVPRGPTMPVFIVRYNHPSDLNHTDLAAAGDGGMEKRHLPGSVYDLAHPDCIEYCKCLDNYKKPECKIWVVGRGM
ncbi:hypothetical protein LTR50_000084 [Elasticomyces elasticus]|nr:hypothetical protein LTR50_000084 [Elasticomyces elasticus]